MKEDRTGQEARSTSVRQVDLNREAAEPAAAHNHQAVKEVPMSITEQIEQFLSGQPHAVVGASTSREKYGNKVLRAYLQQGRPVVAVHPTANQIEGVSACASLRELPGRCHGISIITPPAITERVIEEAGELGIRHVWLQPGAESELAIERATQLGMNVIAGGPCLLVVLGFRE
jgi:predicted CoA-binding protein